jgi:hypothetical protein
MRLFSKAKDGGPKSTVTGYWLVELKRLFSVVLLKFSNGSRDEYHDHAFSSLNWVLRGMVIEEVIDEGGRILFHKAYGPGWRPILTRRNRLHRVVSYGTTWVFSLRGPWRRTWHEYDPRNDRFSTLTHGRKVVDG